MKNVHIVKKNFSKVHINTHIKAELRKIKKYENLIENIDYIRCPICNIPKLHLKRHMLVEHNMTYIKFKSQFPDALIVAPKVEQKSREAYNQKYGINSRGAAFQSNGMNNLEKTINSITDENVIYADRLIWYSLKKDDKNIVHTPDFIIVMPELLNDYLNIKNNNKYITNDNEYLRVNIKGIIEIFGDYWHSQKFTGVSNEQHELDIINFYQHFYKPCLILWEHEIKNNIDFIRNKINNFIKNIL